MEFGLLSKTPINSLADLKEKKVRIGPGLPSVVLAQASGAYTIPLVAQEIYSALNNDDIDAVEWTTAAGVLDLNIHDIAKHAIVPAVWQPSVLSDFLINQLAYDALGDDLKAVLESAMKAYALETTFKSKQADIAAMQKLIDDGVKVVRWSDKDIGHWAEATDAILQHYKEDPYTKKLLDQKHEFKARYLEYYKYFKRYD